ncbi:MAG TPA: HlyD family secretion protein [Methylomusa anaerophila]|uniref:Multidrug export protein EmrA n=1 Tax=Methylomusa anaerophila TaxID=1930071 RepID=A0A348AK03_9FIRM|nr:HlyD family secretion protein [Methylomusa anaerophila]BBB91401.1 multidrug export protein EmrA [Methylomusa anaerophila]HML90174.1 HlyD family secretion protein [Methylomusa anaerophila]
MEKETSKLSNRQMVMICGVLVAILVVGGAWWWIRASRMVSTDDARVKGTIVAVSAKVNGRIQNVLVKEGDHVKEGQIIAVLERQEFEAQVEQAKANLAMAQAKLAATTAGNRPQEVAQVNAATLQAKANLENTRKNSERDEALYQQGAISVQQRDASKTAYEVAQAQYIAATEQYSLSVEGSRKEDIMMAQAQVQQAQAALKNAEILLTDTEIKAPVGGVIALKSIEAGEVIAFGQQLFSISNLADVWIGANIEETYIGRIKVGQPVEFTVDAYPDKKFTGRVSEVGPAAGSQFALLPTENSSANFTKVTQRLPIKIKAEESEYVLKPGMSAIIHIITK